VTNQDLFKGINFCSGVSELTIFGIKWHVKAQWMEAVYNLLYFRTLLCGMLENSNTAINILRLGFQICCW